MLDMHPPILEVCRRRAGRFLGVAALATFNLAAAAAGRLPSAAPDPNCPAPARWLVEHFVAADCEDCWRAPPGTAPGAEDVPDDGWSLDWVAPASAGADNPALPEALPEARERLGRLGPYLPARLDATPAGFDSLAPLPTVPAGRRLTVHSSLPYHGYFGVQMHARGVWPAGATGWMALVENLRAGTSGSALPRHVVRVVVGPLALPAGPRAADAVAPLYALRWPESARPDRLMATAWIEDRAGRVTQITSDRCKDPR